MAVATRAAAKRPVYPVEPMRRLCAACDRPVIVAFILPRAHRGRSGVLLVTAEPFEWEPLAPCQSCAWTRSRMGCTVDTPDEEGALTVERHYARVDCPRCGGSGYVGERRPPGQLLAVDVAWADDGRNRLLGAATKRRAGEALHPLHRCLTGDDRAAIVALPEHERLTA